MKKYFVITALIFFSNVAPTYSQVENPADATKNAATNATNSNIDNSTSSAVNKAKNGIKGLFKKKNKNQNNNSNNQTTPSKNTPPSSDTIVSNPGTLKTYANYDFVPGDKIIFESQLADEQVGEIPSQFNLSAGQMDMQREDGENVIHIPKNGNGATFSPRMKNQTYMPDQFTVEFDFKNELFGVAHLSVDFGQRVYSAGGDGIMPGISFGDGNGLTWTLGDVNYPEALNVGTDNPMTWHHIAIAINKTAGKVYIDQFRVANVNNLTGKANNVNIDVRDYENSYIKNMRIAAGGIDIYKKITTDSKIVTHGILFDIDKATIKPQSMGTINSIYNLLKKDPSLKFEIDGHTDNTGEVAHNLTLSQQRADAVKTQLVSMGIDASRLSTKGFGDTKPISDNSSPEGKANNRRVEFIKN